MSLSSESAFNLVKSKLLPFANGEKKEGKR